MVKIRAANRVSELWGDDPRQSAPADCRGVKIKRAIIVYFEPFSRRQDDGGFFTRIYYRDYPTAINRDRIERFEAEVIGKLYDGTGDTEPKPPGSPDPDLNHYADDISKIKFGRKPCHVSYVMNSAACSFHSTEGSKILVPFIFRKDKILTEKLKDGSDLNFVAEFEPNHSFYNLTVTSKPFGKFPDVNILRVDNFMRLGPLGGFLDEENTSAASQLDYAVDIPLEVSQMALRARLSSLFIDSIVSKDGGSSSIAELDGVPREDAKTDLFNMLKNIVVVFDPPQSNGGNTGPP